MIIWQTYEIVTDGMLKIKNDKLWICKIRRWWWNSYTHSTDNDLHTIFTQKKINICFNTHFLKSASITIRSLRVHCHYHFQKIRFTFTNIFQDYTFWSLHVHVHIFKFTRSQEHFSNLHISNHNTYHFWNIFFTSSIFWNQSNTQIKHTTRRIENLKTKNHSITSPRHIHSKK